jgi:hypothetical protein
MNEPKITPEKPRVRHYVGERVRVKSKDFFIAQRDSDGVIEVDGEVFVEPMFAYCGQLARINKLDHFNSFILDIDASEYGWSDGMFEDSAD